MEPWQRVEALCEHLLAGEMDAVEAAISPADDSAPGPEPEPMPAPTCGRCGAAMVLGYVPDHAHGTRSQMATWYPGPPRCTWLLHRPELPPMGPCYEVVAYRCPTCGRLELYASKPA